MKNVTFNGQCPACELQNNTVTMRYNIAKELECPTCNLRIYPDGKKLALIHRTRGKNNFALMPAPKFTSPLYYIGADVTYDSYSDGSVLMCTTDMLHYIENEVQPTAYKNLLTELITSYIAAFYHDQDVEYYYMISHLLSTDIGHAVFNNNHKSNKYLFHYLHFVLTCYAEDAFTDLEDFAMTGQILDLYNKHVTPYLDIITHDLFLQKQVMEQLMHELIQLIYSPTQVLKK
ncbi:hypothetical protein K5I29_07210 [Flavobacterium agricola]|uniref:Uncharacterized protein n=1 Tax=Flavobacterium agricola TaxID=2870839 RepID=A0ABY6LW14_9FLAO|nr:hypothetical protein [Flavobacterium agricola]UYW00361.1 hypothetical protein K5I29_07210 [Flavobacterium agricola]